MLIRYLIICHFVLFSSLLFSQEYFASAKYRFGITKFDFFTGMEYCRKVHNIQLYGGFEFGVNRTVFQKRFYPKLILGTSYDLLKSEKIFLGPNAHYGYSLLKVNSASAHMHQWHEAMAGFRFEAGTKWLFSFNSEIGMIAERKYNQIELKKTTTYSWGYLGSLGIGYAW